jgi:hypothetical protein
MKTRPEERNNVGHKQVTAAWIVLNTLYSGAGTFVDDRTSI